MIFEVFFEKSFLIFCCLFFSLSQGYQKELGSTNGFASHFTDSSRAHFSAQCLEAVSAQRLEVNFLIPFLVAFTI